MDFHEATGAIDPPSVPARQGPASLQAPPDPSSHARLSGVWRPALLVGVLLFAVYCANFRVIAIGDAIPATLLPLTLIRGEGLAMDRFQSVLTVDGQWPYYITMRNGHAISAYPIGTGLAAIPLVWPQILIKDLLDPGWDRDPARALITALWMGKFAAAAFSSLACALLFVVLLKTSSRTSALLATCAIGLGSDLWILASQTLWQHGAATLALAMAVCALARPGRTRTTLVIAGAATTMMIWCRINMIIYALVIAAWVVWRHCRDSGWFFVIPVVGAVLLFAFNYCVYGAPLGGAGALESPDVHLRLHRTSGTWSPDLVVGLTGTLISPSRGLLIYCPWFLLTIALLPCCLSRLRKVPIVTCLLVTLPLVLLMNSAYAAWWAGHVFGPRYWIEAGIVLAVPLAAALDWSRDECRPIHAVFLGTIVFSVILQLIAAYCYPSGWNWEPVNVDLHHERLWDWRDTELSRCLKNGPRPMGRVDGIALPE